MQPAGALCAIGHVYGLSTKCEVPSKAHISLLVVQLLLLLCSTVANISMPRRPQIYQDGQTAKPIDDQRTVSMLSYYTLSWAGPALSLAIQKGGLDLTDLAFLDARTSAEPLMYYFHSLHPSKPWKHILRVHRSTFVRQWALTVFHSFASLTTQYFMLRLIQVLEKSSRSSEPATWVWLTLLGLAQLMQPWIDTWLLWIGWCHIALPIHVQLSGLIVEKVMRKKDIKQARRQSGDSDSLHADDSDSISEYANVSAGSSQPHLHRCATDLGFFEL